MPAFDRFSTGSRRKIHASDYNNFLRAAEEAQQRDTLPAGAPPLDLYPLMIARVKNNCGVNLDRFDAVGLDPPIITPAKNLKEFQRGANFSAVVPAVGHKSKFGVMLEPLPKGKWGAAAVAGVMPCHITVSGTLAATVEVNPGSRLLKSDAAGSAQLLWAEAAGSPRWAYVRLGGGGGLTAGYTGDITVVTAFDNTSCTYSSVILHFINGLLMSVTF